MPAPVLPNPASALLGRAQAAMRLREPRLVAAGGPVVDDALLRGLVDRGVGNSEELSVLDRGAEGLDMAAEGRARVLVTETVALGGADALARGLRVRHLSDSSGR